MTNVLKDSFNTQPVDLTPLVAFQLYNSIKLHFTKPYFTWEKYGLNELRITQASLDKRKDKSFFYSISKRFLYRSRYVPLLVANLVEKPNIWVGEMLNDANVKKAITYRAYMNTFQNSFTEDIRKLNIPLKELINPDSKNNYLNLYTKKEIHPITSCILNDLFYTKYMSNTAMSFVFDDKAFMFERMLTFIPKEKYNPSADKDNIMLVLQEVTNLN